jgi:FkbM family methyltransferase
MSDTYRRWVMDKGDETLILNYPLNENSQVIELGGYKGSWSKKILSKFNCKLLIIEPIKEYYDIMISEINEFTKKNSEKIYTENSGISIEKKEIQLNIDGDATSAYINSQHTVTIFCNTLQHYLEKYDINKIDLIQVNIEGEEYPLMEEWIKTEIIKKIKFIQIQYHRIGVNYEERHHKIQEKLKEMGFVLRYEYPFIWESWENNFFDN